MNLRMKKEDDDETKRFSNSLNTFEPVEHINLLFSIYGKHFQQPSYGFKNLFYEFKNEKGG